MAVAGFSPALAAYMRQMGIEEQGILAEQRAQADLAERQIERTEPIRQEQVRAAGQGVLDDFETRGLYLSGTAARDAARARTNVTAQQQEQIAQVGDQQVAYGLDAARRVADLRRRALEESLTDRTRRAATSAAASFGGR